MAYTVYNFRTKKALKEAVERWNNKSLGASGVRCYQPNADLTGAELPLNGTVYLEGPHYPEPHKWYAQAELKDGVVIKVK